MENELESIKAYREFFANYIVRSVVGSKNEALIAAFSEVERERFVGKEPWQVADGSTYLPTGSDDPRLLYRDILIGLVPDRGINNGQPSLHARCLAACSPRSGDSVNHIGAGSGYYTAILSRLVGSTGRVTAYEADKELAECATRNLATYQNTTVVGIPASDAPLEEADVIYVNAGATFLVRTWLDAMKTGGRLVLPLTPSAGTGFVLMITKKDAETYAAGAVMEGNFHPCIGARDAVSDKALIEALQRRSFCDVKSLVRDRPSDSSAWCVGTDWWLSVTETPAR